MTNPFSRFLRQWSDDEKLGTLLEHCDALEALIVRVYKRGEATPADEAEYQALRAWMQANYRSWKRVLRPFWKQNLVAGEEARNDPPDSAAGFVGNWETMRTLPAAREALNRLLLKKGR
jgi:hypothetical protein